MRPAAAAAEARPALRGIGVDVQRGGAVGVKRAAHLAAGWYLQACEQLYVACWFDREQRVECGARGGRARRGVRVAAGSPSRICSAACACGSNRSSVTAVGWACL